MKFEKHVLIIGSGPNAVKAAELEGAFDAIVAINNANKCFMIFFPFFFQTLYFMFKKMAYFFNL